MDKPWVHCLEVAGAVDSKMVADAINKLQFVVHNAVTSCVKPIQVSLCLTFVGFQCVSQG